MIEINIAKDFSDSPGGRYKKQGEFSGELFRENYLKPKYIKAIESNEKLIVNFDGCYGFPSSFIDESFGGLARQLKKKDILDNMILISNDQPNLLDFIKECVDG